MRLDPLPRFFPLDRLVPLSDAVFAVVITLLVLGIDIPEGGTLSGASLGTTLDKLWHQILVYFVSFWIVAMYWSQHSLLFAGVKRAERGMLVLNLLFLLPVTLLPFVTQLMGSQRDSWEVVAVFAVTNLGAALFFRTLWRYVAARPEIHATPQTARLARRIDKGMRIFAGIMALGVAISLANVKIGIFFFVLFPVFYFFNYVRDPLRASEGGEREDGDRETPA